MLPSSTLVFWWVLELHVQSYRDEYLSSTGKRALQKGLGRCAATRMYRLNARLGTASLDLSSRRNNTAHSKSFEAISDSTFSALMVGFMDEQGCGPHAHMSLAFASLAAMHCHTYSPRSAAPHSFPDRLPKRTLVECAPHHGTPLFRPCDCVLLGRRVGHSMALCLIHPCVGMLLAGMWATSEQCICGMTFPGVMPPGA